MDSKYRSQRNEEYRRPEEIRITYDRLEGRWITLGEVVFIKPPSSLKEMKIKE